jgi:predicted nucleic acid-binding protein
VSADVDTSEESDEGHDSQRVTITQLDCRFSSARSFVPGGKLEIAIPHEADASSMLRSSATWKEDRDDRTTREDARRAEASQLLNPHAASQGTLQEDAEVLVRAKFGFPPDEIEALTAMLRAKAKRSAIRRRLLPVCRTLGDDKLLSCAKAAVVDFIVTGNKRHFPQRACGVIRVVNGAE